MTRHVGTIQIHCFQLSDITPLAEPDTGSLCNWEPLSGYQQQKFAKTCYKNSHRAILNQNYSIKPHTLSLTECGVKFDIDARWGIFNMLCWTPVSSRLITILSATCMISGCRPRSLTSIMIFWCAECRFISLYYWSFFTIQTLYWL